MEDRDHVDTTDRRESRRKAEIDVPVTMICPNLRCGRTVTANDAARGKVVRCAHCQQLFMVPLGQGATAVPPPAPAEPPPPKRRARR